VFRAIFVHGNDANLPRVGNTADNAEWTTIQGFAHHFVFVLSGPGSADLSMQQHVLYIVDIEFVINSFIVSMLSQVVKPIPNERLNLPDFTH
jgi:hypothetical protein